MGQPERSHQKRSAETRRRLIEAGSSVFASRGFEGATTRAIAEKAEVVVPIKDRPYGKREGRIRDPFGHLWILSMEVEG